MTQIKQEKLNYHSNEISELSTFNVLPNDLAFPTLHRILVETAHLFLANEEYLRIHNFSLNEVPFGN